MLAQAMHQSWHLVLAGVARGMGRGDGSWMECGTTDVARPPYGCGRYDMARAGVTPYWWCLVEGDSCGQVT